MEAIALGFSVALSPSNLLYCFLGVVLGTFIGVLPGIGAIAAISMLLPLTFYLDATTAVIMLAGVYYGAEYGGSTTSILLNLPGTPSNAVACIDGYPMTQQGRAGVALFMTTIASFIGGSIGILVVMFLTPVVVAVSLAFGPAEYFAIMVFGLLAAATVAQGSPSKGLAMVLLGLMLGCVGVDLNSGMVRFNLGLFQLYDGISIVVLAMGLFGVSEVIGSVHSARETSFQGRITLRSLLPDSSDVRRSVAPVLRGAGIGTVLGPLPGTGPTIASFMSYVVEKRVARDPSRFGHGAIEGVTAPEASNNAAAQTAFIPTLALGIPGTATTAIILGALMIHGVTPGPALMTQNAHLFWGVIASFWIGNVMLLVLNIPLIGVWVSILRIPYRYLYPCILALVCIGFYSVNLNPFDVFLVLFFGVVGYSMRLLGFEPAPLIIGFILGPLMEENLRRALLISQGDFLALVLRPISGTLLALAFGLLLWTAGSGVRRLIRQ